MLLKQFFFGLFMSVILVIHPVLPYLEYFTFKNYIIEHYCVNRDKPQMHCDGKCYLRKLLKEDNREDQNKSNAPSVIKTDLTLYTLPENNLQRVHQPETISKFGDYRVSYKFLFYKNFFHPPQIQA